MSVFYNRFERDFVYSQTNPKIDFIVLRRYLVLFPLFLTLIINGCHRSGRGPEIVDVTHLKYEIEYLEEMAGDIPTKLLPRTMDAYYSRNHVFTRIEGFFNQFTLIQIADLRKKQVSTLLDFFGTHVCYTGEPGELPAGITLPDRLDLRYTGDTATIGGFLSERIEVETNEDNFDIYYTREIKVRNPNISTPYQTVNHPLTAFKIELSQLKMFLKCEDYSRESIDPEIFTISDKYRAVSRPTMEAIINNLFTKD